MWQTARCGRLSLDRSRLGRFPFSRRRSHRGSGGLDSVPSLAPNAHMRTSLFRIAALVTILSACAARAAEPDFVPSTELLAAARKEGKIVLYTANFLETEQAVVKRFSQRFPGIAVEIVRAPTGSLITRIKTEAAANRMIADVIDFTDRVQARGMVDLFAPYAPPNAADYPEVARTTDRLWPRSGNAWTITYNSELVKEPPTSWADLTKPEFGKMHLGQTVVA